MTIDLDWLQGQVEAYGRRQDDYAAYADAMQRVLSEAASSLGILAIVQARHKSMASFAEKCVRKREYYSDPANQLTDLCGGRVIVDTQAEVMQICRFVRENFDVDEANSEDVGDRLATGEFGYKSVHFIVQVRPGAAIAARFIDPVVEHQYKAEIQVRTVVQHAWASVGHDRVYKSSFAVPEQQLRELARIAAVLENVDDTFQRIVNAVDEYRLQYDAYLSPQQMAEELEIARAVLPHAPQDSALAQRITSLHGLLGNWQGAVEFCEQQFSGPRTSRLKSLHGKALCHQRTSAERHADGLQLLREAADESDPDALTELGRLALPHNEKEAMKFYERAYEARPSDPRALGGYLECCIKRSHSLGMVAPLRPQLEAAVRKCRDQATVGVNIPEALYRAGQFLLLLNRPYEALTEYCRAVSLTTSEERIDEAMQSAMRISDTERPFVEAGWVERLLQLAKSALFHECQPDDKLRSWSTQDGTALSGPVIILAGGCDPAVAEQMNLYRAALISACEGFHGTLLSGGTTSGVSGIAGAVAETYREQLVAVGYLPAYIPSGAERDSRYHNIRVTDGDRFSALEPLQNWIDMFAAGIPAADVTVLGINGGLIAGFEYRLALALGARVGVIRDSGREAGRLLKEFGALPPQRLAFLPADALTLRTFLEFGRPQSLISDQDCQKLARLRHVQFRDEQRQRHALKDPTMREWNDDPLPDKEALPEWVKRSNFQQIDHIARKLEAVGMEAVAVAGPDDVELIEFTPDEVETMARMEHARWNVERLSDGWTVGERDPEKKISPYLVAWEQLPLGPPDPRKWDRDAVNAIPALLKEIGLEIRRRGN